MTRPTTAQLQAEIKAHFNASADTIGDGDFMPMAKEFLNSPSMILETQQRLQVLSWMAYMAGDEKKCDCFRDAAGHISTIIILDKHKHDEVRS